MTDDPDPTDRPPDPESEPPSPDSEPESEVPAPDAHHGRRFRADRAGYPEWISASVLRQADEAREQLARTVSGLVSPARLVAALGQGPRFSEMFRLPNSVIETSVLSHRLLGDSMITASLAAMSANAALLNGFSAKAAAEWSRTTQAVVASLPDFGTLVENQNLVLTRLGPDIEIARSAFLATRAWLDVVRASRAEGRSPYIDRAAVIGRGAGWAINSGIALTASTDELPSGVQIATAGVLGPASSSASLRVQLHALNPRLPERLDGAWERITEGGSDAASQGAHSLMELVDWTLREIAPNDQVLAWHQAEGLPHTDLNEGLPTRSLRIRFAVRDKPDKEPALSLFLRATSGLGDALQGPKHANRAHSHRALAPVALTVEALLLFLLGD